MSTSINNQRLIVLPCYQLYYLGSEFHMNTTKKTKKFSFIFVILLSQLSLLTTQDLISSDIKKTHLIENKKRYYYSYQNNI